MYWRPVSVVSLLKIKNDDLNMKNDTMELVGHFCGIRQGCTTRGS